MWIIMLHHTQQQSESFQEPLNHSTLYMNTYSTNDQYLTTLTIISNDWLCWSDWCNHHKQIPYWLQNSSTWLSLSNYQSTHAVAGAEDWETAPPALNMIKSLSRISSLWNFPVLINLSETLCGREGDSEAKYWFQGFHCVGSFLNTCFNSVIAYSCMHLMKK